VTFRLEWEKTDGLHRIRAAELTTGSTSKRYEVRRARIDGVDFVTSYSVVVVESGNTAMFRYRVDDLVLNGKKVDVPKSDWPTSDGRK
jgi:hypothetical protein